MFAIASVPGEAGDILPPVMAVVAVREQAPLARPGTEARRTDFMGTWVFREPLRAR